MILLQEYRKRGIYSYSYRNTDVSWSKTRDGQVSWFRSWATSKVHRHKSAIRGHM